ncbi:MAG: cytochrome oxidase assembly protein subunit-controlling protein [Betaproteobacteria bacterium]|jgi:cytochrome c oxidase assembly protein subunit 15|nr:cytochrome oxidase assembly protein subunit-controlling protein [Betaproteobacteria bacterium]
MRTLYTRLVLVAACLAFVVVVVGAYVRLMHAGLGCPDWPGCYGEMSPAHAEEDIARAVAAQGGEHGPVSSAKAWKEMFHRYLAGTLGLLILAIAIAAWRWRSTLGRSPVLASSLLGVVILQAALGMWTVTLLLKPVIVTLHLLGGMATLSLLVWLALRQVDPRPAADPARAQRLRPWAALGLAVVITQIALGGWVSSNYAALACIDFPTCHGAWRPDMDFAHGFQLVRELGKTAAGTHLAYEALTAIHWTHRVGALVTLLYVGGLAFALARSRGLAPYGIALVGVLAVQIGLGVANIVAGLPLGVAVAHNAVAAILLVTLVMINFALSRIPSRQAP